MKTQMRLRLKERFGIAKSSKLPKKVKNLDFYVLSPDFQMIVINPNIFINTM